MIEEKDLKFVETGKGKIYYVLKIVPQAKKTAVFLHGLSSNHTTWTGVLEKFQKLGLNCLVLDLRGHGYSDMTKKRGNYTVRFFAQDLALILKQERLEQIILIGYSGGGLVGLDYALSNPNSLAALVLISTNYVSPLNYKGLGFLNGLVYAFLNLLGWIFIWQKRKHYYYYDHPTAAGYWQTTFTGLTTMPLSINFWMLSEGLKVNFAGMLGKLTCPCLILRGHHDAMLGLKEAADMNQMIKNSTLAVLDDSGHFLASEYQEKMAEAIVDFLKSKVL